MTSTLRINFLLIQRMEYLERLTKLDIDQERLKLIICRVANDILEFLEFCEDIRRKLEYDPSPRPPQEFDPLRTIGKYE